MSRDILIKPQPKPMPSKESWTIKPFLKDYVKDSIRRDRVRKDVEARLDDGEKRYGLALMTYNGRVAWIDYYQEILDAIAFAVQLEHEQTNSTLAEHMKRTVNNLFSLAVEARARMEALEILNDE